MRRFYWGLGSCRPRKELFSRTGPVFLAAVGFLVLSAAADPASANRKYAAIVIDGNTGEVLFSRKADYRRYPASLTKVMTLYMLFEALDSGKIKISDKIPVSNRCSRMPPSKLGLKAGEKMAVETAIKALVVRSANDAACAVGEKLGGTEYKFALSMTKKARSIGLKRTTFRNASGLYNRGQVTTARDMATLALRIQEDFPQYYHYFKSMKVTWKNRTWNTHNRLMRYFPGADGLKTGYIRASGFNLITSARRGNMHLVGVVMGGRKSRSRDRHMVNILERNFARLLKRPDYVYPIADRLPEIRPKPNFAAIHDRKWVMKEVGVLPRPNPFAPEETAVAVIAELQANQPPAVAAPDKTTAADAVSEETDETVTAEARENMAAKTVEHEDGQSAEPDLPVLAASGPGTAPAGGGVPQESRPPADRAATSGRAPAPQRQMAAARPVARPSPSASDTIAHLIEEGDGQVAETDIAEQLPASDAEESNGGTDSDAETVRLASAGPAATHMGKSLLTPSRLWGVQLGAFTSVELAEVHLDNAERLQPDVLTREKSALVPKEDPSGELYRARFGPMEEAQARAACESLRAGGMHCFAIEADDWGEAVRR